MVPLSAFHSRRKERTFRLLMEIPWSQQLLPDCLGGDPLAGTQVELFHQRAQHLVPLVVLGFGGTTLGAVVEVGFEDAEKPAGQVGTVDGNPSASGLKAGELRQSLLHDGVHCLQLCGGLPVLLPQCTELFLQPQQVLVVGTGQLGVESAEPCAQGLVGDAGFILQLRQCPAPSVPDVELPLLGIIIEFRHGCPPPRKEPPAAKADTRSAAVHS